MNGENETYMEKFRRCVTGNDRAFSLDVSEGKKTSVIIIA